MKAIGFWVIEAFTFSRQSAHRWQWGCQPYRPLFTPRKITGTHFCKRLSLPPPPRIRSAEISSDVGKRVHNHLVCSIVPQPTTLPLATEIVYSKIYLMLLLLCGETHFAFWILITLILSFNTAVCRNPYWAVHRFFALLFELIFSCCLWLIGCHQERQRVPSLLLQ
jgi:hypothetical protein